MRKVDVSHHVGFMLPEESIEKLKSFEGNTASVKDIASVFKKFKNIDYSIIITFYPEKDVGEPPHTLAFTIDGGGNEPK